MHFGGDEEHALDSVERERGWGGSHLLLAMTGVYDA